jgi:hypothetical protein
MYEAGGKIGIGTTVPSRVLDIDNNSSTVFPLKIRGNIDNNGGFTGIVFGYENDTTGYEKAAIMVEGTSGNVQPNMYFLLNSAASSANATKSDSRLSIMNTGCVGIGTNAPGYTLEVVGSFGATTKSFVIDHPTKPNKKLQYGSLEGPEHSVYLRGRSSYKIIDLPDYWPELVHEDSITVQLTPVNRYQKLFVDKIWDNAVHVSTDKLGERLDYFYNIYAERKDVPKLEVEIDK